MIIDPVEIHTTLTEHFRSWYAAPEVPAGETNIHTTILDWTRLSTDLEYFMTLTQNTKVPDRYRRLAFEALQVDNTAGVHEPLQEVFRTVPTCEDFVTAVSNTPNQLAPGPTGLTNAMMKAWPPEAIRMAHSALAEMWAARDIPVWWKWRWLVPVPKKANPTMADLELGKPIHRSSWDMSKAFDTESVTTVRTPHAKQIWKRSNYQGFMAQQKNFSRNMTPMTPTQLLNHKIIKAFIAELGTGQGDVLSPLCGNALFDILLVMLEKCDHLPYLCREAAGQLYDAGETAFADDMESTTATNAGMQAKANVVSAFCLIFGLKISPTKLRRYFHDWSNNVTAEELNPMTIYTTGWIITQVPIEVDGVTAYLGAAYDIQPGSQDHMLTEMRRTATAHCAAIRYTTGSAESKLKV
eukprot:gene13654-biopygen6774